MDPLFLLFLALAPGIFLLWFYYSRDRYEPEPLRLVFIVFILGLLVTIPAGIIELILSMAISDNEIFGAAVIAPVVEESLKCAVVFFTVYRTSEFDEPMDGLVYAAASALGFATLENVFYVMEQGFETGILRALLAVPGHTLDSGFWGFAMGMTLVRQDQKVRLILGGLACAMLMHGLYNFFASTMEMVGLVLVIGVTLAGWWFMIKRIKECRVHGFRRLQREAKAASFDLRPAPKFCSICGSPIDGTNTFCTKCGTQFRTERLHDDRPVPCPHCNGTVPLDAKFCRNCGKNLE